MPAASLTVGDTVPGFTASITGAGSFDLSTCRGRTLVLYFYPKDNTPGCTAEAMHFRDLHPEFLAARTDIVGVSRDSLRSHESFKTKLGIPFELISDPEEILCQQFGVMKTKTMYGKQLRGVDRSTFVIDGSGKLVKEWRDVRLPSHVDEVLEFVQSLA